MLFRKGTYGRTLVLVIYDKSLTWTEKLSVVGLI